MNFHHSLCIGISTNILHNPPDIFAAASYLSQNFSALELELEHGARNILNTDFDEIDNLVTKFKDLSKAKNLRFSVHAPYIGADCDLSAEDEIVRQRSCQLLQQVIELSARLGSSLITYHPGYVSVLPTEQSLANLKRSLDWLIPKATALGINLCMENTGAERPSYQLFSPLQYIELCQQTGTFLTLDLIHHASLFSHNGRLTDEFFVTLADMLPYVKNVHFADMDIPHHNHLPIGRGNLPVSQLLDFLRDRNYQGNAIIEETGGGYSCSQFWTAACDFQSQYRATTTQLKQEAICS